MIMSRISCNSWLDINTDNNNRFESRVNNPVLHHTADLLEQAFIKAFYGK